MRKCNFYLDTESLPVFCFLCQHRDVYLHSKPCSECTLLKLEGLEKVQLKQQIVELITKAGTKHPC
jgi:hypothetical protein